MADAVGKREELPHNKRSPKRLRIIEKQPLKKALSIQAWKDLSCGGSQGGGGPEIFAPKANKVPNYDDETVAKPDPTELTSRISRGCKIDFAHKTVLIIFPNIFSLSLLYVQYYRSFLSHLAFGVQFNSRSNSEREKSFQQE